jgi:hypothetical protein
MVKTQVFEFEMRPQENRYGESVGMRVRIEVDEGSELIITGIPTGAAAGGSYEGTLTLRRKRGGLPVTGEGGDECWVNGVWRSPCPTD